MTRCTPGDPAGMVEKRDKVELIWPAKTKAAPADSERPSASIEAVERFFSEPGEARPRGNVLFWGDNLDVLRQVLAQHTDPVDMIYIDPPFFSGGTFSVRAPGRNFPRAYKDTWQDGLPQYLEYMHERLVLMHALLRDGGSMYVHLDWHVSHYIKVMLDEIFGYENFRNQIIWKRLTYKQTQVKAYGVLHDVILFYTKGKDAYTWNDVRAGYGEERLKKYFCWVETPDGKNVKLTRDQLDGNSPVPEGRRFALNPVINPNPNRPNLTYDFLGITKVWKYTREKMRDYHARGRVFQPSPGVLPQKKQYLDESVGMKLNDLFLDIGAVMGGSNERLDFDTQKPLKLLERLIQVSTNPGDTVADFFSGSGTTLEAAEGLGRRWIGCELARPGINATRRRLVGRQPGSLQGQNRAQRDGPSPFVVNKARSAVEIAWLSDAREHARALLALYGADLVEASKYSVGSRNGRAVIVTPPGVPATLATAAELVEGVASDTGHTSGVDVLAGQWALEFGENPSTFSKRCPGVQLVQVPSARDIMASLVGTGLQFEDLVHDRVPAAIKAAVPFQVLPDVLIKEGLVDGQLTLALEGYRFNGGGGGEERAGADGDQLALVDFIGVDWDHDGMVFSGGSCSVQSKRNPIVARQFSHQYQVGGPHVVLVRIIDALGHESSRRGRVDVKL
ncbi:MAG: site-specific DNA-methyltransferase [Candidatus Lokiarchaeota archaeon]|nr:site-specific DNA-methyltransferase [Candidatus Lokiarchaeota archaeon]